MIPVTCTNTHPYTQRNTHTHLHTPTHTYIHTEKHTHTYLHTNTHLHTLAHTEKHTHTHIHTHLHTQRNTRTPTHTERNTHSHTHSLSLLSRMLSKRGLLTNQHRWPNPLPAFGGGPCALALMGGARQAGRTAAAGGRPLLLPHTCRT